MNRFTRFHSETAREIAATRRHLTQQLLDREVCVQVAPDPLDCPRDQRIVVHRGLTLLVAQLRGAAILQRQHLGAHACDLLADKTLDDGESRRIEPAHTAANAEHSLVFDEHRVDVEIDVRIALAEVIGVVPVRRRPPIR